MRIYIIEDDLSVIGILEDIVEGSGLGTICGDTGDGPPRSAPDSVAGPRPRAH